MKKDLQMDNLFKFYLLKISDTTEHNEYVSETGANNIYVNQVKCNCSNLVLIKFYLLTFFYLFFFSLATPFHWLYRLFPWLGFLKYFF